MAEEEVAPSSGGSWWDGIVSSAKSKSVEILEFMKRDFDEFSSAVKTEAASIAQHTSAAVKETFQLDGEESPAESVKRSVSSFFGSVKEALSPSPSTDLDEAIVIKDGSPLTVSRLQTKIYSLSNEDSTYLEEIDASEKKQFEAWLSVSEDLITSVDRLTAMLASNQILQNKYTTLVPHKIDHSKFWQRFLFRKALLEDREAELQRRLDKEKHQAENYPWHEGGSEKDKLGADIDLSEEEQIKILTDYEEEQKKSSSPTQAASSSPIEAEVKDKLSVKEKNGMVIVSNAASSSHASTSSSKASTDGDWEKEFDLDEAENENNK